MKKQVIAPESLKFFTPFQIFNNKELEYVSTHCSVINFERNDTILNINSTSKEKFFLLEGALKLDSLDHVLRMIKARSDEAKSPIAELRPSRYKVTAISPSKVIVIEDEIFEQIFSENTHNAESFELNEEILDEADEILYELIFELKQTNFILPSLPSIALRVRKMISDEDSSADDITKIIITDPVIAAKIVKVANSAMYQRMKKVKDCKTAVISLGTKVTSQLVTAFALKEIFKSPSKLIQKYMTSFWEHSITIATISSILAKITPGFKSEQALLAGLVHDIGNVAILNKALEYPDIITSEEKVDKLLSKMRIHVTTSILQFWNFPEDMIIAAKESKNWMRDESEKPDLADILNMAHLHNYIDIDKQKIVPVIDQVPAFHKMALGKLTPELSIKLLKESNKEIEQIKSIFRT